MNKQSWLFSCLLWLLVMGVNVWAGDINNANTNEINLRLDANYKGSTVGQGSARQ